MKFSSTLKCLLLTLLPVTTSVMAHPGHVANDNAHGFLHVEHIIMIALVGLTLYLIKLFSKK